MLYSMTPDNYVEFKNKCVMQTFSFKTSKLKGGKSEYCVKTKVRMLSVKTKCRPSFHESDTK